MRAGSLVPGPIKRMIRKLLKIRLKDFRRNPAVVVKSNTRDAFEFVYSKDEFIEKEYLTPYRLAHYEVIAEYIAGVFAENGFPKAMRVVDIGCGIGNMLDALRRALEPKCELELHGLDFACNAIEKANVLLPTATFKVEDIFENSLPSNYFDLVLCIETLEHLREPEKVLAEMLRICRQGGAVVITVPDGAKDSWDGHVNFWTLQEFKEFLIPHGLVDIKVIPKADTNVLARLVKEGSAREQAGCGRCMI